MKINNLSSVTGILRLLKVSINIYRSALLRYGDSVAPLLRVYNNMAIVKGLASIPSEYMQLRVSSGNELGVE